MIPEAYEELRKRFKVLPAFEDIDKEFEISTLENERFLLRGIKKRMVERLEDAGAFLGDILHPSSEGMALMYEYRFINQKEKRNVLVMFKRVQFFIRSFSEADLVQDDEFDAKLIAEVSKAWKAIRKDCVPLARILKEAWVKETDYKEDLGYLG